MFQSKVQQNTSETLASVIFRSYINIRSLNVFAMMHTVILNSWFVFLGRRWWILTSPFWIHMYILLANYRWWSVTRGSISRAYKWFVCSFIICKLLLWLNKDYDLSKGIILWDNHIWCKWKHSDKSHTVPLRIIFLLLCWARTAAVTKLRHVSKPHYAFSWQAFFSVHLQNLSLPPLLCYAQCLRVRLGTKQKD